MVIVAIIGIIMILLVPKIALADNANVFDGCSDTSINTAIGCVPVDATAFTQWLLKFVFGIAGGIAFLLMVYGFIQMSTSAGDPKAVAGAQETVTSAITGLMICIFALFLLRLITVNILHIPGIQ